MGGRGIPMPRHAHEKTAEVAFKPERRSGPAAPSLQLAAPGSTRSAQHPASRPPGRPRCRCPAWPATASSPSELSCGRSDAAACAFSSAICCSASSSFRSSSRCRVSAVASTVATILATSPVIAACRSSSHATVFSSRSAAACRRSVASMVVPPALFSSIVSSLSCCASPCRAFTCLPQALRAARACLRFGACLPCAQAERRSAVRSLLAQQDRRPGEGHLRQPPHRSPHVFHMGIGQFVAHAHLFGRRRPQLPLHLGKIPPEQISRHPDLAVPPASSRSPRP